MANILSYFRFNRQKPDYKKKSSQDGIGLDIDEYYEVEEHQRELKRINKFFPESIEKNGRQRSPRS